MKFLEITQRIDTIRQSMMTCDNAVVMKSLMREEGKLMLKLGAFLMSNEITQ